MFWLRARVYLINTILPMLSLAACGTNPPNLPQAEHDQSTRIAIVDLLAVAERTTIGRQLLADSKGEIDQLTHQIEEETNRFSQVERSSSVAEFRRAVQERQMRILIAQQALFPRKIAPLNKLSKEIEAIVKPLAEKEGFAVVLAKGTVETFMVVMYAATTINVTDYIIEELNRRSP